MRCNFCGRDLANDEEEYEDDSKGLNYEILQARSNNSSDTVNTIEYLLMCLDCKYQTPYGYLWFAVCDARDHVLTSEHKQVTITEIIWQNNKALEILRIDIKSAEVETNLGYSLHDRTLRLNEAKELGIPDLQGKDEK